MENIVSVTVDSLRADCCGFLGAKEDTTPFLDDLATNGLVFENAMSPGPRTPSSMPSVFTEEFYTYESHSMNDWRQRRDEIAAHFKRYQSFASMLKKRGYSTIGITANPWTAADTGFDTGFDTFQEVHPDNEDGIETLPDSTLLNAVDSLPSQLSDGILSWGDHKEWFSHWSGFFDTIRHHAESAEDPFFIWIFLMDSHNPYITPRKYRKEATFFDIYYSLFRFWRERHNQIPNHVGHMLRKAYRDTVRSADAFIERLYNDIFQDTDFTFVFHADHGEAHGDHGLYGHEYQLFEENIHIPWLVHGGGYEGDIQSPVTIRNMKSVLRNIAEGNPISKGIEPGPVISKVESKRIAADRGEMLNYTPHHAAIRGNQWKLIETAESSMLFDLSIDSDEQENVASKYPDIHDRFQSLLHCKQNMRSERQRIVDVTQNFTDKSSRL